MILVEVRTDDGLAGCGQIHGSPIKAICEHAREKKIERPITLYWGGRLKRDLYQLEAARSWPHVKFIPVLSDEPWEGRTGFVHQAVLADFRDLSGYQVYACGAPAMIDAAKRDFTTLRKLPEDEFYADSFTYAAQTEAAD